MSDTGERAQWVTVSTYSTGLEADIARDLLEAEDIPVLVQSNSAGIFGIAFQGSVTGGIALQVPSPEEARARELLEAAMDPDGADLPPDAQADGVPDDPNP